MSNYVILGSEVCSYCTSAKNLLDQKGYSYDYFDMKTLSNMEMIGYMDLAKVPFRTVPQIFKREEGSLEYIGGFDQLRESLVA